MKQMVKYYKVDFIHEPTNQNMTRLFMVLSSDFFFEKFCLNNGISIRNKTEVDAKMWYQVPKDRRQSIVLGKEKLNM